MGKKTLLLPKGAQASYNLSSTSPCALRGGKEQRKVSIGVAAFMHHEKQGAEGGCFSSSTGLGTLGVHNLIETDMKNDRLQQKASDHQEDRGAA